MPQSRDWKGTAFVATTIDGHIARKDGSIDFLPPPPARLTTSPAETAQAPEPIVPTHGDMKRTMDLLVMGRKTYETVLSFGSSAEDWPYGRDLPVLILTTQKLSALPRCPNLNASIDVVSSIDAAVSFINERGFKTIWIDGGATVRSFLERGMVDEMVLTTVPVLLGEKAGGGLSLWEGLRLKEDVEWEVMGCEVMGGMIGVRWRAARG